MLALIVLAVFVALLGVASQLGWSVDSRFEGHHMPPFMDTRTIEGGLRADDAAAHQADLAIQDEDGAPGNVNYLQRPNS